MPLESEKYGIEGQAAVFLVLLATNNISLAAACEPQPSAILTRPSIQKIHGLNNLS